MWDCQTQQPKSNFWRTVWHHGRYTTLHWSSNDETSIGSCRFEFTSRCRGHWTWISLAESLPGQNLCFGKLQTIWNGPEHLAAKMQQWADTRPVLFSSWHLVTNSAESGPWVVACFCWPDLCFLPDSSWNGEGLAVRPGPFTLYCFRAFPPFAPRCTIWCLHLVWTAVVALREVANPDPFLEKWGPFLREAIVKKRLRSSEWTLLNRLYEAVNWWSLRANNLSECCNSVFFSKNRNARTLSILSAE